MHKAKAAVWQMALPRIMLGNEFYAIRLHRIDAHTAGPAALDRRCTGGISPTEILFRLPRAMWLMSAIQL